MRLRLLTALLVTTVIPLTAWAPPASAGSYTVVACDDATSTNGAASTSLLENNSWTYTSSDTTTSQKVPASGNTCQPSSDEYVGLGTYDIIGSGPWSSDESYWTFAAPSDTTITGVSIDRHIGKHIDDNWHPYGKFDGTILDECTIVTSVECGNDGRYTTDSANSTIAYGYRCDRGGGCSVSATASQHWVWSLIYGSSITLSESVDPVPTLGSGDLTDTSSYHTGTDSVTYSGTDARGIKAASLKIDNVERDSDSFSSECDYTQLTPCIDQTDQSLSYNTSLLSDDTHTVKVCVTDAAGNEGCSVLWPILVDQTAPAAPTASAFSSSSSSNSFSVSWTNPSSTAPITKAYYKLCDSNGSNCSSTSSVSSAGITGLSGLTVPSEGTWQLRVWLEDAAGNVNTSNYTTFTLLYDDGATSGGGASGSGLSGGTSTTTSASPTATTTDTTSSSTATGTTSTSTGTATAITTTPTASKASVSLKLKSASLKRHVLRVSGTCALRPYKHKFTLTYKPEQGTGKTLQKSFKCSKGKFKLTFKAGKKRRGGKVRIDYKGDSKISSARASKRLRTTS